MDDLNLQEVFEHGHDRDAGNLLGIQPFMRREDYASEEAYTARIRAYLKEAAGKGWTGSRTVAVLPEHTGTWLVTAGESPRVYSAETVQAAMLHLALARPGAFLWELLRSKEKDRAAAALFRMKAGPMARIYQSAFARLAKEFEITIAAGSIVLPTPAVADGQIAPGKGPLYNTAFVFGPDGQAAGRFARKYAPIEDEKPFVTAGPAEELPVVETPAGRLGVLVCADSWFPEAYQPLQAQQVELVAVPSASGPGNFWEKPWGGYNGRAAPGDVDPDDVGKLTERQAWSRYALAGRMGSTRARAGINVFLYGDLWDLDFAGGRWRMVQGETDLEGCCYGPALINLWL